MSTSRGPPTRHGIPVPVDGRSLPYTPAPPHRSPETHVSRSRFAVLSASVLAAVLASGPQPATAQCFGGDGLDLGPCCTPVVPNLPAFPAASLPAVSIATTAYDPSSASRTPGYLMALPASPVFVALMLPPHC